MKKKNLYLVLITFLALLLFDCKRNSEKAMEYNNFIANEMKLLTDLEQEIAIKDGPELDKVIDKFKKAVPESKAKIEKLGSFENDDSLQKAALNICNFYLEVIEGKWSTKGQEAIQNNDAELDNELQIKQKEFAKKFNFEIKN